MRAIRVTQLRMTRVITRYQVLLESCDYFVTVLSCVTSRGTFSRVLCSASRVAELNLRKHKHIVSENFLRFTIRLKGSRGKNGDSVPVFVPGFAALWRDFKITSEMKFYEMTMIYARAKLEQRSRTYFLKNTTYVSKLRDVSETRLMMQKREKNVNVSLAFR